MFHDYKKDISNWGGNYKKAYIESKKNINEENIEICINDNKIKFNTKYKSNEKGEIKATFKFNKLLTNTSFMFLDCLSLKSIDLFSFNTTKVENINSMFMHCSSLISLDLSSFNKFKVNNMSQMF